MEAGNSDSFMASNMQNDLNDTVYSAQEWAQNRQLTASEQRLAAMVQALLDLEARNNELALAIKTKDTATMDKHIEYHRLHGNLSDSMARQTVLEVNKTLNDGQPMEWQIS